MSEYAGLYRGVCTRNKDPENRFRIRVRVPVVSGMEETSWAMPCLPPGWKTKRLLDEHDDALNEFGADGLRIPFDTTSDAGEHAQVEGSGAHSHSHRLLQQVPRVGEGVWVMYEGGDLSYPVWIGVF
jgi:hypothetical protein